MEASPLHFNHPLVAEAAFERDHAFIASNA